MLDHGITVRVGTCVLRPTLDSDEEDILSLWNASHVVGRLFMSPTSQETYRHYFDAYRTDPNQYRWTVTDDVGRFVGTIGLTRYDDTMYVVGFFALWPTEAFLAIVPIVLAQRVAFEMLHATEISFTIVSTNSKIRKLHLLAGAEKLLGDEHRTGSNGAPIVLEHWRYTRATWLAMQGFYAQCCR